MSGYVYFLRSIRDGKLYIGSTDNLERRIDEHIKGKCHTTLRMLPIELVFYQKYPDLVSARKVEYRLKSWKRKDIIERIVREGQIRMGP